MKTLIQVTKYFNTSVKGRYLDCQENINHIEMLPSSWIILVSLWKSRQVRFAAYVPDISNSKLRLCQ